MTAQTKLFSGEAFQVFQALGQTTAINYIGRVGRYRPGAVGEVASAMPANKTTASTVLRALLKSHNLLHT
jgi:predicted transcriptional regulator